MGFEALFEKGRRFDVATVEPVQAGTLRITSGTIAVCDPSSDGEDGVLERRVPNGAYPVLVSRELLHATGEPVIAAAIVRFRDASIAGWQPALPKGKNQADLEPGQHFGYGVDAGIACFVDGALACKLDFEHFEAKVVPKLQAIGGPARCGEVELNAASLVAFNSGVGDGFYVSFWGIDAQGEVPLAARGYGGACSARAPATT